MCVFLYVMMFLLMSDFFYALKFSAKNSSSAQVFGTFDLRIHTKH
jgi:hypothetical protein